MPPSRANAKRKGQHLQRLAQTCLEARGWLVCAATDKIVWIPDPRRPGQRMPISTSHDFYGVWDFVLVKDNGPEATRGVAFAQVTTIEGLSARRKKILASGFPASALDRILAYKPGRDRHFKVYRGPLFTEWEGDTLRPGVLVRVEGDAP